MIWFLITPYYSDSQCRADNMSRLQLEILCICVLLRYQSRCLKANLGNWLSRLFVGLVLLWAMVTCLATHSHSQLRLYSKSCFFSQLAMLSSLQCVRKAPRCIEVLGSSFSRGLLKDDIGWGRPWAVVEKGRENWNTLLSSLSLRSRNPDLQGIWANAFLTLLSTVPLIPHSAGSAVPRFFSPSWCQGCFPVCPCFPGK